MLTPFQLNQLSHPVINIYSQLEKNILTAIAERLKTGKDVTKDNVLKWQFDKLAQLNDLNKDVIKLIANMSGKSDAEINTLVQNSMQQSVDPMDQWLQKVADTGKIEKAIPLKQDTAVFNTLRMFQKQAKDNLNLINSTILRNSGQVYRDILSQATAAVLSGFKSHQQALADASAKWAQKGIPALIDSAGRQWSIEGYVPLVTRTVSNNVANQAQWDRMDSYKLDLIEVTTVAAPRPGCAPYQGHIYSKNGRNKRHPSLKSTTYGQPAGLFGCNCHHTSYPYIPGVTIKRYDPIPLGEAHAAYEQSQKQRYLERQIRRAKTEAEMMKALGNEKAIQKANMKIRQRQQNMREFIKETNRTRRYDREQIVATPKHNLLDEHQKMVEKAQQKVREKIKSGSISTQINPEKQARHMQGDPAYEAYKKKLAAKNVHGPSYLTINIDETQQLVNKYAGTGDIKINNDLSFDNKETIIQNERQIGYYIDREGHEHLTGNFDIRYSGTGVHIFPVG